MRMILVTALLLAAPLPALTPALAGEKSTPVDAARPAYMEWAFDKSDVPLDPDFRFGRLANGMRYVIRHNATPAGTAVVRMEVAAGSLDEHDHEQGFAHFVEHMAFNGSKRVPEGQMIPLLERDGLAFGADTNASTSFERTVYKLDLPRTDARLLDTALMLMRETASELTISQAAIERERGVVLSEMRDRNTFALRNTIDSTRFFYPGARYASRFPIGTSATLAAADATNLRAFYEREYVPAHVTLVIVGDFDAAAVEAGIVRHFGDWQPAAAEPQPDAGPVDRKDRGRTGIWIDPALSERLTIQRNGPWLDEPDTIAQRQENLLRSIGYAVVNRRLQRLSRSPQPPFRGAGFGTGDVFETARSSRLIIDSVDGKWSGGLAAAAREYRRALAHGFSEGEVAEQIAQLRTSLVNAAASANTRSNAVLAGIALALIDDRIVPSTPASALERFEAFAPRITAKAVHAAVKREAVKLDKPLIRFEGRRAPEGGEAALRTAWQRAMRGPVPREADQAAAHFAYGDFGAAGTVVSDRRDPVLGIRQLRFANGVMLNLKQTELEKDRVRVSLSIDGGDMLDTRENPLATDMVGWLEKGGLGKHSRDDLDTIMAGHSLGFGLSSDTASFGAQAATTPRDLELQLQLLSALITDPGYRLEGEVQYRQQVNNTFAQLRATPSSALGADLGRILSDDDPRFSLQPVEAYRHLTFAKLRESITDRLSHGAIELGLVGDFEEDKAIAFVAATFGALPLREAAFRSYDQQPPRTFTSDRSPRVVRHTGPADQALLRLTWPTRDDADPLDALRLQMLERVVRIELTDSLREALGKAYSPSAGSSLSHYWKGYGTFAISASIDVADVPASREAIAKVLRELRAAPVSDDVLQRARAPLIEAYQNALKGNAGWLSLVDRAQSQPDQIERFSRARDRLTTITSAEVQAMAQRYLDPARGLEVLALPEGVDVPRK
ncbi:MAG: insulinase family protein [Novosphingobium lindaniclasticum]|jgi:zinc protease|uniref:M16 family metallopeptidase n=1 Tax=Novosphingobium lindaniclasticum TaxID=1329895 RepID=UPI0024092287|nr:insulinase family protein [Novosphingobium lindaniclasticum]MDF2638899.1 insulinase family protein [Novosphingobium lindaniclasticum]